MDQLNAKLYADTGDGFNPSQMIQLHTGTGNRTLRFDLKRFTGIVALRFHPDVYPLDIRLISVKLSTAQGEIDPAYSSNAEYDVNGFMEFDADLPFILINTSAIPDVIAVEVALEYRKTRFDKLIELYRDLKMKTAVGDRIADEKIGSVKSKIRSKWQVLTHYAERIARKLRVLRYRGHRPVSYAQAQSEMEAWSVQPLISVIMPVYNADPKWLEKAVESVKAQYYPGWELCIADDASTRTGTIDYLRRIDHPRIKITFSERNENISSASNRALSLAEGEFVALLDHDDVLTPDALFEVVKRLNAGDADFIYSDEDKLIGRNKAVTPHFKPDFSPETLLSRNYITHLAVIRKSLIDKAGGFRIGYEGSQDHDLFLRITELTDRIVHIPKVLYHWRVSAGSSAGSHDAKDYAWTAGREAVADALKRRNIAGTAEKGVLFGTYRVKRTVRGEPKVSIVIPFKDRPELLRLSIGSVLEKSTYRNFEIVGVNNNSENERTLKMMSDLAASDERVRFINYESSFNYAAINNFAVKQTEGEHIVLMNNDVEVITPDWIEQFLQHSQEETVGVVGGKLYFPDGTVQHAGVIVGTGLVGWHGHKHAPRSSYGYFGRLVYTQNVSAVTGALMMIRRKLWDVFEGLDENLAVAYNDVDLCLRLREAGYLNVFTPWCEMIHHESVSRGYEDTDDKKRRLLKERYYTEDKHRDYLDKGDPYYNPNLSLKNEKFEIKL